MTESSRETQIGRINIYMLAALKKFNILQVESVDMETGAQTGLLELIFSNQLTDEEAIELNQFLFSAELEPNINRMVRILLTEEIKLIIP